MRKKNWCSDEEIVSLGRCSSYWYLLVSWKNVCRPKEFGGLWVLDLVPWIRLYWRNGYGNFFESLLCIGVIQSYSNAIMIQMWTCLNSEKGCWDVKILFWWVWKYCEILTWLVGRLSLSGYHWSKTVLDWLGSRGCCFFSRDGIFAWRPWFQHLIHWGFCWRLCKVKLVPFTWCFSVKSYYSFLIFGEFKCFASKIWKVRVPSKFKIHMWVVIRERDFLLVICLEGEVWM